MTKDELIDRLHELQPYFGEENPKGAQCLRDILRAVYDGQILVPKFKRGDRVHDKRNMSPSSDVVRTPPIIFYGMVRDPDFVGEDFLVSC